MAVADSWEALTTVWVVTPVLSKFLVAPIVPIPPRRSSRLRCASMCTLHMGRPNIRVPKMCDRTHLCVSLAWTGPKYAGSVHLMADDGPPGDKDNTGGGNMRGPVVHAGLDPWR